MRVSSDMRVGDETGARLSEDDSAARPRRIRTKAAIRAEEGDTPFDPESSVEDAEDLWESRKAEFSALNRRVVLVLQSHHSSTAKAHLLCALHDRVVERRMRLRSETYQDILACFAAVATPGFDGRTGHAVLQGDTITQHRRRRHGLSHPLHEFPFLDASWSCYQYMVASGTRITAEVSQQMMALVDRAATIGVIAPDVEARAHTIMRDLDAAGVPPTPFTLNHYFRVCAAAGAMHLALARFLDTKRQYAMVPSAGMCTILAHGLVRNGMIDEAVRFVATLVKVPIDVALMNTMLLVGKESGDPRSVFAMYRSLGASGLRPSSTTVSIMMEAWLKAALLESAPALPPTQTVAGTDNGAEMTMVSAFFRARPIVTDPTLIAALLDVVDTMRRGHVRGDPRLLNRVLLGLNSCSRQWKNEPVEAARRGALQDRAARYAASLLAMMRRGHVRVFEDWLNEFASIFETKTITMTDAASGHVTAP